MFGSTKKCNLSHKMMIRLNNFLYVFNLRQGTILIAVHQIVSMINDYFFNCFKVKRLQCPNLTAIKLINLLFAGAIIFHINHIASRDISCRGDVVNVTQRHDRRCRQARALRRDLRRTPHLSQRRCDHHQQST